MIFYMIDMPDKSYKGDFPPPSLSQQELSQKYLFQLNQFATEPRNVEHIAGLRKAEDFIIQNLKNNGFDNILIQSYQDVEFKNFEVSIEPFKEATQTVVIGAHYDSAGNANGADDNASSVVILLELAKRFKEKFNSNHTRIKIVFFTNEEPPFFKGSLMGSAKYARLLYEKKEPVIGMYSFDALGYFKEEENTQDYPLLFSAFYPSKGNFVAFVGNLSSRDLIRKSVSTFRETAKFPSEGISAWQYIPGIDYSDHVSFYHYGWKGMMITDTAFHRNHHYHTTEDTIDKLDLIKMAQLTDELEIMFRKLYEN